MASCSIKYIEEKFKGKPELIKTLTDIEVNIWNKVMATKTFRREGNTLMFSKRGSQQLIKQNQVLTQINKEFDAPRSLFGSKPTVYGNNSKLTVSVLPLADRYMGTPQATSVTEAINRLKPNITGIYQMLFEMNPLESLYTIAVQGNTSEGDRNGAVSAVGEDIVKLALSEYPKARLGLDLKDYALEDLEDENEDREEISYLDENEEDDKVDTDEEIQEDNDPNEQKLNDLLNNGEITTFCE